MWKDWKEITGALYSRCRKCVLTWDSPKILNSSFVGSEEMGKKSFNWRDSEIKKFCLKGKAGV